MQRKIKNLISFSIVIFVFGFIGSFLGKSFEKTKLGQKIEKSLGIANKEESLKQTAQTSECFNQEQKKDSDSLFVGCNGFF